MNGNCIPAVAKTARNDQQPNSLAAEASESAPVLGTATKAKAALSHLDQLKLAQKQRAAEYRTLTEAFRECLDTGDEAAYRTQMAASTQTFQESSALVREAITGLDQKAGKPNLAEMLRNLQKEEQYKLRFTLILQALRKAEAAGTFSWQQGYSSSMVQQDQMPAPSAPGCCSGTPEPSQLELEGAIAEAIQELQAASDRINEVLEELMYAEEELRELSALDTMAQDG